jgi:molybdopterin synthase catalytic subunit
VSFAITRDTIAVVSLRRRLEDRRCGAMVCFEGWVRDHSESRSVLRLEYEVYEALAQREGEAIIAEARERFGVVEAACVHRVGALEIGDCAVWVGVSSAHRAASFEACRYIIDQVKLRVPIWKKELFGDGGAEWIESVSGTNASHERHTAAPEVAAARTEYMSGAGDGTG